jgi:hypothetical protein
LHVAACAVLRRVESQQYALDQDGLVEYIKALVLLGKFDRNDLRVRILLAILHPCLVPITSFDRATQPRWVQTANRDVSSST